MKHIKPPDTGISIVVGVPGSGKSYWAVLRMVDIIIRYERPVWTNIPLNIKRIRAYIRIRAGRKKAYLANFIRPLTRDHFQRFADRLAAIDDRAEQIMNSGGVAATDGVSKLGKFDQTKARELAIEQINAEQGEPIIEGPGANWIPPLAVTVLDELHKWYPSKSYRDEPKALLDYLSMHRHIMHRIYVLTQMAMNVSATFRRMAVEFIYCIDKSRIPLFWVIRAPFRAFFYTTFDASDVKDGEPKHMAQPTFSDIQVPALTAGIIYQLYRSYSHAGDMQTLTDQMEALKRQMAGDQASPETVRKTDTMALGAKTATDRLWERLRRWSLVGLLIAGGWGLGRCSVNMPEPEPVVTAATSADNPTPEKTTSPQTPPAWPRLDGITDNGAIINGSLHRTGDTIRDARIIDIDATRQAIGLLHNSGALSVWRLGREPDRVSGPTRRPARPGDAAGRTPAGPAATPAGETAE